jgi:dual 3',5'-cyclic-AMP and -GMP phosphodiesterase 11
MFCQQAFAQLSDKLVALVDGVRQNKQHWLEIAKSKSQDETCTNHDRTTSPMSVSDNEEISEQADQ